MPLGNALGRCRRTIPRSCSSFTNAGDSTTLRLDRDFVRAIEDTIELLIAKEIILFTDLPPKVQEKLLRRKKCAARPIRRQLRSTSSDIIPL